MNPFFSKKSITSIETLIQDKVDRLCIVLSNYANTEEPIELGLAHAALSLDIISHYAFGKSFGLVEQSGFSPLWKNVMNMTTESFFSCSKPSLAIRSTESSSPAPDEAYTPGLAFYLQLKHVCIQFILR